MYETHLWLTIGSSHCKNITSEWQVQAQVGTSNKLQSEDNQIAIKHDFSELTGSGNSIEIFPLWCLMVMITMRCSFKSHTVIGCNLVHFNT